MGRPPIYNNCLDMDAACELYFEQCDEKAEPYTIPGLAYALGFCDKETLGEYGARPDFSRVVKGARLRIESQRAVAVVSTEKNPAGKIFDLKANFGWRDTFPEDRAPGGIAIQVLVGGREYLPGGQYVQVEQGSTDQVGAYLGVCEKPALEIANDE